MDLPFDTKQTDDTLAASREREEEDVASIVSQKYGISYADLSLTSIDSDALRVIPEEKALLARAAAFAKNAKHLSLALENPNNPALAPLLADLAARGYEVKQFLVSKKSLDKALDRYKDLSYAVEAKAGTFAAAAGAASIASLAALKERLDKALAEKSLERVSRVLEDVLLGAEGLRASDIHFEPEQERVRLRLRLDGLLTDAYFFDPAAYHQLKSRIKLLSGIKLNVTDRAQDGRFTIDRAGEDVEVRVSFIPGAYGESIVMRLLDPKTTQISFKELGINEKLLTRLDKEIRRANGMLLTTGPTGSGKTTSLYAFLREIHTPDIKIITIEDPIEYHLEGIVQTQVEADKYTFPEGLRSIVRQDPDVIMVGEIRDGETAAIAIQAALTGHFVYSTLHTNNAAGTFPRLVDLGADPKSFASAITVSMAQRLVRKLDPEHRKGRALTETEKKTVDAVLASIVDKSLIPAKTDTIWDAVPEGENNGYHGRVGLYEAIFMDDEIGAFLRDNPPESEIAKAAAKQGYLTMAQDGVLKALAGLTTLDEVGKTVDLPQG
jgi:type IV pilus assembly protein PilB